MNLAILREELPCDYSVTGSATRLFQKSLISAPSHPVLPIPWALQPDTLGLSLPVVICLNPFSCLYLPSGTVSFYTLFLFLVLPSSILFNSPSLSMPVWFYLQCFLILQSPYWVPFFSSLCLTLFLSFFVLLFLFILLLHLLVLPHISLNLSVIVVFIIIKSLVLNCTSDFTDPGTLALPSAVASSFNLSSAGGTCGLMHESQFIHSTVLF